MRYNDFKQQYRDREAKGKGIIRANKLLQFVCPSERRWNIVADDTPLQYAGADYVGQTTGIKLDLKSEVGYTHKYWSISLYRDYGNGEWKNVLTSKETDIWLIIVELEDCYRVISIDKLQAANIMAVFPIESANYDMHNWEYNHLNYICAAKGGSRGQLQVPFDVDYRNNRLFTVIGDYSK